MGLLPLFMPLLSGCDCRDMLFGSDVNNNVTTRNTILFKESSLTLYFHDISPSSHNNRVSKKAVFVFRVLLPRQEVTGIPWYQRITVRTALPTVLWMCRLFIVFQGWHCRYWHLLSGLQYNRSWAPYRCLGKTNYTILLWVVIFIKLNTFSEDILS